MTPGNLASLPRHLNPDGGDVQIEYFYPLLSQCRTLMYGALV